MSHPIAAAPPSSAWWTSDAVVVGVLVAGIAVYAYGAVRTWRGTGMVRGVAPWQAAAYGAGIAVLGVALLSSLDPAGDMRFWAHMAQHELMMLIAAPLIVLGRPGGPLLRTLPRRWRGRVRRAARRRGLERAWWILTTPAVALAIHAVARWLWHLPATSAAALADERIHALQHLTLFGSAVLLWWTLIRGRYGAAGPATTATRSRARTPASIEASELSSRAAGGATPGARSAGSRRAAWSPSSGGAPP